MTYAAETDIGEGSIDCSELSDQMAVATNRIRNSIESIKDLDSDFRGTLPFLLQSFVTTHTSIRAVLRHENVEKYDKPDGKTKTNLLYGSDAMSLVREQVEKVFTVTLLCHDPRTWIREYLRDDWRRVYERELYQREVTADIPRFQRFHAQDSPVFLEGLRKSSYVSVLEKEWVEYRYRNETLPPHLKGQEIRLFPTPNGVIKKLKGEPSQEFLKMLYKEYIYICGYTHIGSTKLQPLMMADRKVGKGISLENKELYYRTAIEEPAVLTSLMASLSACTETLKFVPNDLGILEILTSQWEALRDSSFLARSLWHLRAKSLFPAIIG